MLAVFVIWGLDTEGDAENPVFNLCWERFKRVGIVFKFFLKMKKLNFEKFTNNKVESSQSSKLKGGSHVRTTRDSTGEGDWRDCSTGEVVLDNGSTLGQGPTGC
jgi:hypothetical protein